MKLGTAPHYGVTRTPYGVDAPISLSLSYRYHITRDRGREGVRQLFILKPLCLRLSIRILCPCPRVYNCTIGDCFAVLLKLAIVMAAEFIGYNVLVTLKEPPGGQLVGQVANVFGQRLLLQDGEHKKSLVRST